MSIAELSVDPFGSGDSCDPGARAQWRKLDLPRSLNAPAAFVSISQTNSVYEPWGAQGHENHRARGSLEATIRVVQAARKARNFVLFNWVGYSVFREDYPKSLFDEVQYAEWVEGKDFTPEQKRLGQRTGRRAQGAGRARRQPV